MCPDWRHRWVIQWLWRRHLNIFNLSPSPCVCSLQLEAPEEQKELTPEEQLADKLRLKKLQEESDLELAKETFGEFQQQEMNSWQLGDPAEPEQGLALSTQSLWH